MLVLIGYPLMLRSGFSLGGLGSGKINNQDELITKAETIFKIEKINLEIEKNKKGKNSGVFFPLLSKIITRIN